MPQYPSVLILTAGFGDGHNSAARSIAEALAQESGGGARVLVVVVSADARAATAATVLAAGASYVLTKPLDLAELDWWLDTAEATVSGRSEVS